jgi:hypothetical protein
LAYLIIDLRASQAVKTRAVNQQRDPQHAALWWRLKKIESLPKRDQKALLHYFNALVQKNVAAG